MTMTGDAWEIFGSVSLLKSLLLGKLPVVMACLPVGGGDDGGSIAKVYQKRRVSKVKMSTHK